MSSVLNVEREYRMKKGAEQYIIRPMRQGDGAQINSLRRMPGVFENILGIPSENLARSEAFAASNDPLVHAFVAETLNPRGESLIVGTAGLHLHGNPRMRHSGGVGIMIHRDFQGQGIGRVLMQTLIDMADNWLMLERVELSVFVDNTRAIELYKSLGFEMEGTKRKAVIRSGIYTDEYIMSRLRTDK